jgi:hypothetical protein
MGAFWLAGPRIKAQFQELNRSLGILVRALGLGIIGAEKGDEQRKLLIHKSRLALLASSAIHLVPTGITIFLIRHNYFSAFIGNELSVPRDQDNIKMGALQVAAKVQVCTSSETTCSYSHSPGSLTSCYRSY